MVAGDDMIAGISFCCLRVEFVGFWKFDSALRWAAAVNVSIMLLSPGLVGR
jgi:hypothetical protein